MIEYIFELAFSAGVTRTTACLPASPQGRRMYSPAASFASTSASFFAPLTARMSSYISRRSDPRAYRPNPARSTSVSTSIRLPSMISSLAGDFFSVRNGPTRFASRPQTWT